MTTLSPEDAVFALAIARRTAGRGFPPLFREDLVGAGLEAAVLAARRFDGSLGVPLRHYLAIRVRGAVVDEWRRLSHSRRHVRVPLSLERAIEDGMPELRAADDLEGDVLDRIEREREAAEAAATLEHVLGTLTAREAFVLRARAEGRPQRDIGDELGVTAGRVCQIEHRARRRAKAAAAS